MGRNGYLIAVTYAIALACSLAALAQQPESPSSLIMSMKPYHILKTGLPAALIVRITNTSNHDILIPEPRMACSDGMYGSLFFRINVQPWSGPPPHGYGCFIDSNFAKSLIEDRIKTWKRLMPGQSLLLKEDVGPELSSILQYPFPPGTYEFTASYRPPYVPKDDQRLLTATKIHFSQNPMTTRLSFTKTHP